MRLATRLYSALRPAQSLGALSALPMLAMIGVVLVTLVSYLLVNLIWAH